MRAKLSPQAGEIILRWIAFVSGFILVAALLATMFLEPLQSIFFQPAESAPPSAAFHMAPLIALTVASFVFPVAVISNITLLVRRNRESDPLDDSGPAG